MECLRCGAKVKDNTLVCNKCGFIVKGSKKLENVEAPISFEERINNASAEELRAMILAYKQAKDEAKAKAEEKNKKSISPEARMIQKGKRWATTSFICGLASFLAIVVPGINVIVALILFLIAFMGFGQCAGQRSSLALVGVALSIIAIFGAWAYNSYLAPTVAEMLGLSAPAVEEGVAGVNY